MEVVDDVQGYSRVPEGMFSSLEFQTNYIPDM